MTSEETGRFLALLAEGWRDAPDPSSAALALWQRMLADLPYALAEAALEEALLVGTPFCPKPSEIRRRVVHILFAEDEIPAPAQAWRLVSKVISEFWDRPDLGLAALPIPVRRVAQAIGWYALNNEESAILRAHFLKMYETEQQRAVEEAVLPDAFKVRRMSLRQRYIALKDAGQPALEIHQILRDLAAQKQMESA